MVGHQRHETRRIHTGILSVSGWPHPTSLQGSHRNVQYKKLTTMSPRNRHWDQFQYICEYQQWVQTLLKASPKKKVKKYLMQNGVSRSSTHANVTPSSADICIFHKSSRFFLDNADSRLDPTTFCQFSSPVRYSRYSSCETQRASRRIVGRYSNSSYRKEQHTMLYHWGLTYLSIRYVFLYWGTLINISEQTARNVGCGPAMLH